MTQEEKQLLLIDLCARLPYGVKVRTNRGPELIEGLAPFCHNEVKIALNLDWSMSISSFTPYLRSMSSMTEEEKKELGSFVAASMFASQNKNSLFQLAREALYGDFFNKHHFDYRGLIEKGLALEAPEGMYNY